MREITFRGKRVDNGDWVYGFYGWSMGKDYITSIYNESPSQSEPGGAYYEKHYEVIPETVGQLLTSDNNPNYFEGDIVADTLILSNETDFSTAYAVTWDNFKDISPTEFLIGNIYDNPEMLHQ